MTWFFFGEAVWETISLLAISLFLIFHFVHYVSRKKFAMFQLLIGLAVVLFGIIMAVKLGHVVPSYRMTAAVDAILLTAMALIIFDFIVLFARACGMGISPRLEALCFWIIGVCYIGASIILLSVGTPDQLMQLDRFTDVLLQPFWILVMIRLIFLSRNPNEPKAMV